MFNRALWCGVLVGGLVFLAGCGGGASNGNGTGGSGGSGGDTSSLPSSVSEWTWVSGNNNPGGGYQGVLGVSSVNAYPGASSGAVSWTDTSGNLWLFGGTSQSGTLNALWEFTPSSKEWTWVDGSNQGYGAGVYGTEGVPSVSNIPPAREGAVGWRDGGGNLWLFGGSSQYGEMNDVWEFNPTAKTWTWVSGSETGNIASVYGTEGVAAAANTPGGRDSAVTWIDASGNLWLFGGKNDTASFNDLWEFSPSTSMWTWMGGSSTLNAAGVYGTMGVSNTANIPGSRWGSVSWTDNNGNVWLFGGSSPSGTESDLNDLWEFSISSGTWKWVGGSNTTGSAKAGVYGTENVAASSNAPGSRGLAVSWVDKDGNLWLFGGQGYDSTGTVNGDLNDLWRYSPSTNEWTWVSGSNSIPAGTNAAAGDYGKIGVPSATNVPGGRDSAVGWVDAKGDFWLFGGEVSLPYNDLWQYQP